MQSLQMELLQILKEDCRVPLEQLATMTGAPLEEVAQTIDQMEKSGVILRYAPIINWDRTDRERVEAMIEVRVTPQRDQGFDLRKYAGKEVQRFQYVVTNYPNYPEGIRANLLVFNRKIIGGDLCSLEFGGFMHGFENLEGENAKK